MPENPEVLSPSGATTASKSGNPGLFKLTADFATSQVAAFSMFLGAVAAAYLAFLKLQNSLQVSVPLCAGLVSAFLALFFFTQDTQRQRSSEQWLLPHRRHKCRPEMPESY